MTRKNYEPTAKEVRAIREIVDFTKDYCDNGSLLMERLAIVEKYLEWVGG